MQVLTQMKDKMDNLSSQRTNNDRRKVKNNYPPLLKKAQKISITKNLMSVNIIYTTYKVQFGSL